MKYQLSVSVAILTEDKKLLAFLEDGNRIDVPGGYLDPTQDLNLDTGVPDLFKVAKSRLIEEIGIRDEEISQAVCLGLSYEYNGSRDEKSHPVASFVMKTKLTANDILKRQKEDKLTKVIIVELFKKNTSGHAYVMDLLDEQYPMVEPDG